MGKPVRPPSPVGERTRLRDLGIGIGRLPPGRWNAITDIGGVRVGHTTTSDSIGGNVSADQPLALIFHSNSIGGNVTVQGGGGVSCTPSMVSPALGFGVYSTFEDNQIAGNVVVSSYQSCWFGFIRYQVQGQRHPHQ